MRIALPAWNQHLSPVFDWAEHLLVVDVDGVREKARQWALVTETHPVRRAEQLVQLGVEVLICGALTQPLEDVLTCSGIRVWAGRCGRVDEVLEAFLHCRLNSHRFCLPGCCGGHPPIRQRRVQRKGR